MKISPPISDVAKEVEAWAQEAGWKAVGLRVAELYHATSGGTALPAPDNQDGLDNAVQRVKRIFRGYDGPRYGLMAEELKEAALCALPADRRKKLVEPESPVLLATIATRECTEAINAIHLGATSGEIFKEAREAINAICAAVRAATNQILQFP